MIPNKTLLPHRLKMGDTIGIVSPSTPVTDELSGQFTNGVDFLKRLGFEVVVGMHATSTTWRYTAPPMEKAEDINRMFADDSISAIICSQGGATANGCLPLLDWDCIRQHPKIFLGISDITVLLNAIHHKTGLITFHGDDVMWGFGRQPSDYDKQEFLSRLVQGEIGKVHPRGESLTTRRGIAEGKLLGGNLNALLKLAGTHYFPDFSGAILMLEALNISPESCDHLFQQLKQMDVFRKIHGALVGYIDGLQNNEKAVMQMEEVLLQLTSEYTFPILKVNNFGHNCPNTTLPVGARVRIDADRQEIEILENCVRQAG